MLVGIVLAVRFMLEIITIIGLFSGIFISKSVPNKIIYLILSISLAFIWARYGAPKSPNVLIGTNKLILEIVVYAIGSFGFYRLFGNKIGTIYLVIVIIDLILMYVLGLQGK